MMCHAMTCYEDAVRILEVKVPFRGEFHIYKYGYCAQDFDWFKETFESHGIYEVTEITGGTND